MSHPVIELVKRSKTGKVENQNLRKKGYVPVVLYGKNENVMGAIPVVLAKKMVEVYYFMTQVVNIKIDGKNYLCIPKDVQFNPVTDNPDHFDFKIVELEEKIVVSVPVVVVGQEKSVGIKRGGHVVLNAYNIKLNAKVGHIPREVEVDVSDSVIGSKYYVADLKIQNATPIYDCLIAKVAGRQVKEEAVVDNATKEGTKPTK